MPVPQDLLSLYCVSRVAFSVDKFNQLKSVQVILFGFEGPSIIGIVITVEYFFNISAVLVVTKRLAFHILAFNFFGFVFF